MKRCAPEAMGVRREAIEAFLKDMQEKRLHMHAFKILRHGQEIARGDFAPWSEDNLHMLFSLSKSFTSTAVGFAVQDGLLKVTDHLTDFFPEYLPALPCENMQKITVRDLLTMNTGHGKEPERNEKNFVRSYVEYTPGTHFLYNTSGTYMLSAIVQKVTGKKLLTYLREKLMDPLGMSGDIWTEESETGVAMGGFGLNVRVDDIARLGQFYLDGGCWEGKQLLDPAWVRDAQTPWSDNSTGGNRGQSDWSCGYGYQFWMCKPEHVFRGDGAFGQYCIICPDQDMVIAINSGVEDMGAVMDSIWKHILPAVSDSPLEGADRGPMEVHGVTRARWEDMGKDTAAPVTEKAWRGSYQLQKGNMLGDSITVGDDFVTIVSEGKETVLPLKWDTWMDSEMHLPSFPDMHKCAVRAARKDDALILHVCITNTPFEEILKVTFTAHGLTVHGRQNVGFGGDTYEILGTRTGD